MKDISKIYPGTIALKKINIKIRCGEIHGIIGKNGAVKSTLVNIFSSETVKLSFFKIRKDDYEI